MLQVPPRRRCSMHCVRSIQRGYTRHAEGSVLVAFGDTRVLCTASVEEKVPPHKRGSGEGWVTAEYGMLPRATHTRSDREAARGKQSGRTQEIQRLIGRSLRACSTCTRSASARITLDCDVLQADGGTRTAAITGAFVAAHDAVGWLLAAGQDRPHADPRRGRRGLGRHRAGHAAARPRIRRGLGLRHRHERRDDRRSAASSNCRARPKAPPSRAPRWMRCWRWPARASANWSPRSAGARHRLRRGSERGGCGWSSRPTTPASCAELRRCSRRSASSWWRRASSASPRPRSRIAPSSRTRWPRRAMRRGAAGGRRSPTTPGLCVDALGGAPGVDSAHFAPVAVLGDRETQRRRRTTPTTRCCSSSCTACADRRAALRQHAGGRAPRRRSRAADRHGRWHGRDRCARRAGSGGFGYDPLMFIPRSAGPSPSSTPASQERATAIARWPRGRCGR